MSAEPAEPTAVTTDTVAPLALTATFAWLGGARLGLVAMALLVGALAGLGAVLFRWLVYAFTWLATGYQQFGQQGRVGSLHFPWLGIWFRCSSRSQAASCTGR